jgi:hypothetical protein
LLPASSNQTSAPGVTAPGAFFIDQQTLHPKPFKECTMTATAALQLTTADIHHVTGYTPDQQNQYFLRGAVPTHSHKKPKGPGDRRLVGSETAYAFAIFGACTELGLQARCAVNAVRVFATGQPGRPANKTFELGRTLLLVNASGAQIINADYNASLIEVCGRTIIAAATIDIGAIIKDVDSKLTSIKGKKFK